ncbi:hypothetical protein ANANG_G00309510 [Anguilla anguilla]|uniref:Uncharacterized protein n=1 Tax=Anguilla anguilla TaxID=7936 RepID=A0A9D3LH10_ANGAN|nr:hypothetical protein ANANG_G00309510 [Anguilla anguilla]
MLLEGGVGQREERLRISPSDGDSLASDPSSGRESTEENLRAPARPARGSRPAKRQERQETPPPETHARPELLPGQSFFFCPHFTVLFLLPPGARTPAGERAGRAALLRLHLRARGPDDAVGRRHPPRGQQDPADRHAAHAGAAQHSPAVTERVSESAKINKEIQVALRHKSEIEHHRNKIRLRAKRRGHYDFPAMDDIMDSFGDLKDPEQIYQKAQMQIDKILDPDAHVPSIFMEPRKSARGRRSPKQRKKPQVNGTAVEDKDRLITTDSDGTYRKYPGVNNVAYVSDPDQLPEIHTHRRALPLFATSCSWARGPRPGPAPPPPAPAPTCPQPSIEEARQQMHSLLDDAFAWSPPPRRGARPASTCPAPAPARTPGPRPAASGAPPTPPPRPQPLLCEVRRARHVPALSPKPIAAGLGSGYPPSAEPGARDQLQPEALYSNRAAYPEELPSSARPRPVGGTTGAQLHHLTQVGLSSRIGAYPGAGRASSAQTGASVWGPYRADEEYSRSAPVRDTVLCSPDSSAPSLFQMPRTALREPSAPPAHLDAPGTGYPSAPGGELPAQPLLRLPHQGHPGGADAPLPETGRRAQLPRLNPNPPSSTPHHHHHHHRPTEQHFPQDSPCHPLPHFLGPALCVRTAFPDRAPNAPDQSGSSLQARGKHACGKGGPGGLRVW